ncbi:MAG TPA: hypothetical protein VN971_05440, partial [Thermoanaerobaculia bacterium]|nr:hypothetical protein [Thermoanaerobaculia bacterium]
GWLEALLEIYAADSDVGAVGGLVLTPEGLIAHAGIVFDPFGVPYHAYRGARPDLAAGSTRAVPALAGCGLLVARRTFVALGGFDERLPTDHALIDLSLRLRARSLMPVYCPKSVFRLREAPAADRSEPATGGDRLLSEKWEGRLWRDERLLVEDGVDPVDVRPKASAMHGRCGLAWSAPLFVRSGYAEEARSFVLALDDAGYAVTPIDVAGVTSGLGAADDRLTELTEAPLRSPFAEVVHYHGPGIPLRPDATRRVWRTMFEAESLPPNWADYANQMDEVWVPSDFNLESFARAGVRPSKLRKLPGGLDFAPYDPDVQALPLAGARGFVFLSALIPQRRKGWDVLLRAYYEEFGADDDVSLVVKVTAGPEHA